MKNISVQDIEKEFNVKLLTHKEDTIFNFSESNSYLANKNGEIVFLNLKSNNIKDASFLKKIKSLKVLILNTNPLQQFSFLEELPNLTELYLGEIPTVDLSIIGKLTNLIRLTLFRNEIDNLLFLKDLKKLKFLYLSNNKISDISPLINLINLEEIDLRSNKISDIEILKDFTKLKYIDLAENQITEIKSLKVFIESGLPIFSDQYVFAEKKSGISIGENPLQYPSYEIVNNGNDAIIRYFEKIAGEGSESIFESKLTLVGEGSAGKTSLQRKLVSSKAELPKEDKRTRGIEVIDWEFKKLKGKTHIAHIWDFGGQDVYYPVHRFFLTENSVFVLLASSRQNTHNFEYWIPTIFQFGGKSPIILAQTCHDGNTSPWNDLGTYLANENFNIIKESDLIYHEINLKSTKNIGLSQIKKSIINQIINLPHYKKNVPKSWIGVRELINDLKKNNCISYIELKEKIRELNIDSFSNKEDIEDCLKFFHDIGIILWYYKEDNLKDWIILNPSWSVDAVYKIIDDDKILKQKGIILHEDFERVWKEKKFDDKHIVLKDMLSVFKIAFPKKHNKRDFLIPARLLSMPKESIWAQVSDLHIEYKYDFMPKGLVNQISAELSRYIIADEQVWNNGVNLTFENSESQVFEDFYNRRIIIKASGQDARGLLILIMNSVKNINEEYKGVSPKIIIPCPCEICKSLDVPEKFAYENLIIKLEKNSNAKVMCNNSDKIFDVDKLLYTNGLSNPIKGIGNQMKKVFISYSKHDDEYKKEFVKHLITLKDESLIDPFNCDEIELGENSHDIIQKKLLECDYMVSLVSVDFLNTEYIRTFEVDKAIDLGKKIIPIIIKPCDWESSKLGKFHASLRGKNISLDSKLFLNDEIKETTEIERQANWVKIIKEFRIKLLSNK